MRYQWFVVGVAIAATACDGGSACTFNSDCPAGSHCAMGACRVECDRDTPCPTGEACTSFGECVATDAGTAPDAGPPALDAGPDASPSSDAGTDAGPPAEVCTPSTPGSSPADEDGDGAIDEGCPWHFGVPHWSSMLRPATASSGVHTLSEDGLRLYLRGDGNALAVGTRASTNAPFGAPAFVPSLESGAQLVAVNGATLSSDEREVIFSRNEELWVARRASASVPFGLPTALGVLNSTATDWAPFLSRDGLELFFASVRSGTYHIYRSTRPSTDSDDWSAPAQVTFEPTVASVNSPALTADGLTLFFNDDAGLMRRATRSSTTETVFTEPSSVDIENTAGSFYYYVSERTRELFFTDNAAVAWSPGPGRGIWRAEICRDGPCPARVVDCPTPGVRSPDGLHCYRRHPSEVSWTDGAAACAAAGGHLVTIHSAAEQELVWSNFGGATTNVWLGLQETSSADVFTWLTGEPLAYTAWGAGEPNPGAGEAAVIMAGIYDGRWADFPASPPTTVPVSAVCETELWPTW